MQTADQLNLFSAPPPTVPATMQTVMVKSHPRRVRASVRTNLDTSTSLPFAPGSETSREAAEKAEGTAEAGRARVLACLVRHGAMTNDEIGQKTGLTSGTVCPRMLELRQAGKVVSTGRRGITSSGGTAWIWEAVK